MIKKITLIIVTLLLLSSGVAQAQIYLSPEDANNRDNDYVGGTLPFIPEQDTTIDQYAPLGSGLFLLGVLGGAYLLNKRRKDDE